MVTRILSITSISQLIIGLSCLNKNKCDSRKYNDILVINNTMLTKTAISSIKNISNNYLFCKIIDLNTIIAKLNSSKLSIKIYKLISSNKFYNSLRNSLYKMLGHSSVDEIYIRYKCIEEPKISNQRDIYLR